GGRHMGFSRVWSSVVCSSDLERERARRRMLATQNNKSGKAIAAVETFPPQELGKTRDKVAAAVGLGSGRTSAPVTVLGVSNDTPGIVTPISTVGRWVDELSHLGKLEYRAAQVFNFENLPRGVTKVCLRCAYLPENGAHRRTLGEYPGTLKRPCKAVYGRLRIVMERFGKTLGW